MKTKKQLIALFAALTTVKTKGGAKFKYNTLKNLKIIESEIEALKTVEKEISEILVPFDEKRSEVIQKYGKKLPDGSTGIEPNDEDFATAKAEIETLQNETFKADFEKHATAIADYNKLLDEAFEQPFTFHEITEEQLPDDITDVELEQLMEWEIVK